MARTYDPVQVRRSLRMLRYAFAFTSHRIGQFPSRPDWYPSTVDLVDLVGVRRFRSYGPRLPGGSQPPTQTEETTLKITIHSLRRYGNR